MSGQKRELQKGYSVYYKLKSLLLKIKKKQTKEKKQNLKNTVINNTVSCKYLCIDEFSEYRACSKSKNNYCFVLKEF